MICGFCQKPIVRSDALRVEISDATKGNHGIVQGFLAHRECLKNAVHPLLPLHSELAPHP
jgi:hypothetical protein